MEGWMGGREEDRQTESEKLKKIKTQKKEGRTDKKQSDRQTEYKHII